MGGTLSEREYGSILLEERLRARHERETMEARDRSQEQQVSLSLCQALLHVGGSRFQDGKSGTTSVLRLLRAVMALVCVCGLGAIAPASPRCSVPGPDPGPGVRSPVCV